MSDTREQKIAPEKLTDEQREELLTFKLPAILFTWRGVDSYDNSTLNLAQMDINYLVNVVEAILSSEQTWKEEYKEEKAAHNEHAAELVQLEKRFNQAMEVLKWYAENEYRSGGRAKDFLKSLSQGIETNEST